MTTVVAIILTIFGIIIAIVGVVFVPTAIFCIYIAIRGLIDEIAIYRIVSRNIVDQSDVVYLIKKRRYFFFWRYVKGGDYFKHNFPLVFEFMNDASAYVRELSKGYKPKFESNK